MSLQSKQAARHVQSATQTRFKLAPLTLMVQVAILTLAGVAYLPESAQAQTAPAQAVAKAYQVPAGSLSEVLGKFAAQAGVALSFDPALVAGLHSQGLQGSYSVQAGFATLLTAAGFEAVKHSDAEYTLKKIPVSNLSGETALPTINVAAGGAAAGTTEGSGSFTSKSMSTATKLSLSQRETPQAVTVMTRERLEEQGLKTLNDVVQNTPGMTLRRFGPERASYFSRGFDVTNVMYDGLPVSLDGSHLSQDLLSTDSAVYDRIEVVRGAAGLTTGAGNPSAAINLIRKRPTKEAQVIINTSVGSWDRYRAEIDAGGPLSADGSLRARGVLAYQDHGSYIDRNNTKRTLMYGIVEKDFGHATTLTLSAMHQRDNTKGNGFTGLPVASDGSSLNLPRSTSYANDWEFWNKATNSVFAGLEHRFDNRWKMNLSAYRNWAEIDMLGHYLSLDMTTNKYIQRGARNYHDEQQGSYDIYATGPFNLLGREHQLVVGASQRNLRFDGETKQGVIINSDMDLYNWDPSSIPNPNIELAGWLDVNLKQKSTYATTRLNVTDKLKVILGGRLDWYDYSNYYTVLAIAPANYKITRQMTKYAGLVYDLDAHHSVYASYTDIFKPQNYYDVNNVLLDPIKGKNYEIGIKGAYFDGNLNASLAIFRMDQENRSKRVDNILACSTYPTACYEAAGLVRSQGIDVEIQGALTPHWQVGAGYTYTEAKYVKDADPTKIGTWFDTDVPRHLFKASTLYKFAGDLQKWRIGGSLYWQNAIYNEGKNSNGTLFKTEQKSYALVDLVIGYKATRNMDIRLNINNIFDKTYYNSFANTPAFPSSVYGDPRNFMLNVNYTF